MSPTSERGGRLAQIDVLRGLAAAWVVLSHYLPHWDQRLGSAPIIVPNLWGQHAVELFFSISGFVVFMTLDKCRGVLDFAVLRFSRLYPVYWTTLIAFMLFSIAFLGQALWVPGFVANLTMFQEFVGIPHIDNVYWSLSVELAFYANASLWLYFGIHHRVHGVVTVWLLAAIAWALLLEPVTSGPRDWFARLFALDYAAFFAVGMLFYDAVKRGWTWWGKGLVGLALLSQLAFKGWPGLFVATLLTLLFALAVRGNLQFLVSRATVGLGMISYSLYLVHRNFGYSALDFLHAQGIGVAVAVPVTILGAIVLAVALTYYIEQPAIRIIRSQYEKWKGFRHSRAVSPPSGL